MESRTSKTLLVLPTGTGKTVVFSKVVEEETKDGSNALILAHRGELLDQASEKHRNEWIGFSFGKG